MAPDRKRPSASDACYAHFGILCTSNGDCLLRDGRDYGIDDGLGIACLIASSDGSCFGFSEALSVGGPAVACK